MIKYCDSCKKERKTIISKINEKYKVLGDEITVNSDVLTCSVCGSHIFDESLDEVTLKKVYDKYKERHNLLSSKDIVNIRNKYGLSQRGLSKLLGWGDKTIFRYEKGSIQDTTHNYVLSKLQDEKNMIEYINENKNKLDSKLVNNVLSSINYSDLNNNFSFTDKFDYEPSIYSGYKCFDYNKTCEVIRFFIGKFDKIQSVKLLKLINYADMLFFKENTVSISGLRYKHYKYGPIPENYDLIFHNMMENNLIDETYEILKDFECHYYRNTDVVKDTNLNYDEICVLECVYNKFKDYGSKEISDYSHLEKGYKETKDNEYISYIYANNIELELS